LTVTIKHVFGNK